MTVGRGRPACSAPGRWTGPTADVPCWRRRASSRRASRPPTIPACPSACDEAKWPRRRRPRPSPCRPSSPRPGSDRRARTRRETTSVCPNGRSASCRPVATSQSRSPRAARGQDPAIGREGQEWISVEGPERRQFLTGGQVPQLQVRETRAVARIAPVGREGHGGDARDEESAAKPRLQVPQVRAGIGQGRPPGCGRPVKWRSRGPGVLRPGLRAAVVPDRIPRPRRDHVPAPTPGSCRRV